NRPGPLAVLEVTGVVAEIQRHGAQDGGQIEEHQACPGEPLAVKACAAAACRDVVRGPDEGDAGPAVERVVGVDRAQPAEGEPCARAELGRTELIGEDQSHEGREHQPEGGGQGISRKNARQRGVRRFRGAVPLYDGYGALPTVQSCLAGQPKQLQSRSALTQIKRRWNARPGSNAISNETRWRCVCLRMASASIRGVEHALTRGSGKYGKLRTSWRFTGREIDFQPAAQESWPPPPVQGIQACRIPLHDPSASRQAVEHFSAAPAR